MQAPIKTDALVIGAGPVGLFQVFQLGLQGISCHVVDSLPQIGGQCMELYADKPIYDIPGIPVCTGSELIAQLAQQIQPFGASFHLEQLVTEMERLPDGRLKVSTSSGTVFSVRCVFIAAGVGAFLPRKLAVEGLQAFEGQQVFHKLDGRLNLAEQHLLVAGDNDAALETAVQSAQLSEGRPASITLLHRRDRFQASEDNIAALHDLCAQGRVRFVAAQPTACIVSNGRLTGLEVLTAQGLTDTLPVDMVIASLGLSPRLGPLADWGLALERKQLPVQTDTFATHESGIFAVGDINTYPGKKKLIVCGFHEATLAAFGAAALLNPAQKTLLQYTTTSSLLHQRLGLL
jgi:thioredoxin reductase (NADPH)